MEQTYVWGSILLTHTCFEWKILLENSDEIYSLDFHVIPTSLYICAQARKKIF